MSDNQLSNRTFSRTLSAAITAAALAGGLAAAPVQAQPPAGAGPSDEVCALLAAAGAQAPACQAGGEGLAPEIQAQVDALTRSVQAFYNYDVAVAAGWDTILGECVESPLGGMGYHVHNMDQLLNGHLNLLRPEVLLYAPTEDGSMAFQGVEYIIPADLWDGPGAPEFLGQELHFNPNVPPSGIWALHVWVATPNPDGLFADFNPEVSCEHAAAE